MKRAEIMTLKGPLTVRTYDTIPKPPPKGVVVKTTYCGICHTDIHLLEDDFSIGGNKKFRMSDIPTYKFPIVPGHEIGGIVHSIGKDVDKGGEQFEVGDNVLVYAWIGCEKCGVCDAGEGNYCKEITTSHGLGTDGGYSEYVVVSKKDFLVKVPDKIPMSIACMLPCSGLTSYNAVTTVAPTIEKAVQRKGKATLLIVGAGGLGLWCLQSARAYLPKATKLLVADVAEEKLQNAMKHGADDTVLWEPSLGVKEVAEKTKGKSNDGDIDAIIDFVNSSETTERGFGSLKKGGAMALVGLFGGSLSLPLPVYALNLYQIFGVYVGTMQQLRDLVALVAKAGLMPPNMSYVKLEEAAETLEKLKRGQISGRAIIKF